MVVFQSGDELLVPLVLELEKILEQVLDCREEEQFADGEVVSS